MTKSTSEATAVTEWRKFASTLSFTWNGKTSTLARHIQSAGFVDEERLIQPTVFPAFADAFLDWQVQLNLAPEEMGDEGKPDFTPADSVTHPFVFETKSTKEGAALKGFDHQVARYLIEGRPRIRKVVLTNLIGIRVFELDDKDELVECYAVDLRYLLLGSPDLAISSPTASRFARFIEEFSRKQLSPDQKVERIRESPPWNPFIEITSSEWILRRLDRIVQLLTDGVKEAVAHGALSNPVLVSHSDRTSLIAELNMLTTRMGDPDEHSQIEDFVSAPDDSLAGKAMQQYCSHVAYFATTRLMLVRTWEDLGLLEPMLYDGGFDTQMERCAGVIADVIRNSFYNAERVYPSLFEAHNNFTWFKPREATYIEAIYELASTYLGAIQSDVLGQVYERMLERIDRKLLGQYYTPRDIIALVWDLIGFDQLAEEAEQRDTVPRVLDIATGSGGFLVEFAARLRKRLNANEKKGVSIDVQSWINDSASNLIGVEIQLFSAYLAEINLLVQFGQVIAAHPQTALPSLSILAGDTLALHDVDTLEGATTVNENDLSRSDADTRSLALRVINCQETGLSMDVACGNPPYIGQKVGAKLIDRMRRSHPYWEQYVGHHMDYLYWFLILGISKLKPGGRFGFVTTEYWLRAVGAKPLRQYLADHCDVERLVLLRNFRPFSDAQGQHTLLISGRRKVEHSSKAVKPRISVFESPSLEPSTRGGVIDAIRRGASSFGVRSFTAPCPPSELGDSSWSPLMLSKARYDSREAQRTSGQIVDVHPVQGVVSSANRMRKGYDKDLTVASLESIGWPSKSHGIFILDESEVAALGQLNQTESDHLKLFVNTADVFPYATLEPTTPNVIVYLPAPDGSMPGSPFPEGLPRIQQHLTRFKPLLENKVSEYGEDRPWWSLHRPRQEVVLKAPIDTVWADVALTRNWGGGSQLVVGLAPANSVPAQGLNALISDSVSGAYLSGVLNCTAIQQLAETLPPGYLRISDFKELGIPQVGSEQQRQIEDSSLKLAGLVRKLAQMQSFPTVTDCLLNDISIAEPPANAWKWNPPNLIGTTLAKDSSWLEFRSQGALGAQRISHVEISDTLLGLEVLVHGAGKNGPYVGLRIKEDSPRLADAVAAQINGLADGFDGKLRDIASLQVPVNPSKHVEAWDRDVANLELDVADYRELRASIDEIVEDYL